MDNYNNGFAPFREKMESEGLPEISIETFAYYYNQLVGEITGYMAEKDLEPVKSLPDFEELQHEPTDATHRARAKTVIFKVNGGLGTSMGLNKAKSLLKVRGELSFLDIIARQAIHAGAPLVLMNSFATRDLSLEALQRYDRLKGKIPLDFVQHKVPKVKQSDLSPVSWPVNPALEWCPPGHGDIYNALVSGGMLDILLGAGYLYGFVSNADNLGAVLSEGVLGYFVEHELPFMMEVADRSEADKKGGHLGRLPSGQLILRETAQCAKSDLPAFGDVKRHKYFNTNNLWFNLAELKGLMKAKHNIPGLPMICNPKTVDPRDGASTPVYHLETAMGSAIAVFTGAQALRVPRSRFSPVKTTSDLLPVYSDAYVLSEEFSVMINPARKLDSPPVIELDPAYYQHIDQLEARIPYGPPSLIECERLTVEGDIKFGRKVVIEGVVRLVNKSGKQVQIADNSRLSGEYYY